MAEMLKNMSKSNLDDHSPFFALPTGRKTSLEIINEARASIKAVETKRPFTPHENFRRSNDLHDNLRWISASRNALPNQNSNRPLTAIKLFPLKRDRAIQLELSKVQPANRRVKQERKSSEHAVVPHEDPNSDNHIGYNSSIKKSKGNKIYELHEKLYSEKVYPLILKLNTPETSRKHLIVLSNSLYVQLKECNLLSNQFKGRSTILRTLFSLLDQYDTQLLLSMAKTIIAMNVSGRNRINIFKLIYKVSKNESNDRLFDEKELLEIFVQHLLSMKTSDNLDCILYGMTTLKFLSANSNLLTSLNKANIVQLLNVKMVEINDEVIGSRESLDAFNQIMVQITGATRNLLESEECTAELTKHNMMHELLRSLEINVKVCDIIKNIFRALSKLTSQKFFSNQVMRYPSIVNSILYSIKKYSDEPDILVRACYVLGNLTGYCDEARREIFDGKEWFDILLSTLDKYIDTATTKLTEDKDEPLLVKAKNNSEDVLVKVFRIFANMSISEEIGFKICQNEDIVKHMLQILCQMDKIKNEELISCILSTMNNLSYYCIEDSAFYDKQEDIITYLLKILEMKKDKETIETIKVLGNLSRVKQMRDVLIKTNGAKIIMSLLDSENTALLYYSCGVIMNLMLDEDNKLFSDEGKITQKLLSILQDYGRVDWCLCSLVCQALWNFVTNFDFAQSMEQSEINHLVLILEDYLDEDGMFNDEDLSDLDSSMKKEWHENFSPVALDLLEELTSTTSK